MDIKSFLPNLDKGNEAPELYWSLLVEPDWVQAGIWRILEDKAQVVYSSSSVAWKLEDELIQAIDGVLSTAQQDLPENIKEPSKTVFGVVSSWVKDGEIKEEQLGKIKKICSDLSLEPTGFVVLPEAIAHLTKSEEGSPMSAVVLGISNQEIEVSVFRLGELTGTSQIARSVSIVDDVVEGLSRFAGNEPLPSRFILYNGKEGDLDDTKQLLINADWDSVQNVKFLHEPKIEIVNLQRKVDAVSLAGASEIAEVNSLISSVGTSKSKDDKKEEAKSHSIEKEKIPQDENLDPDYTSESVTNIEIPNLGEQADVEKLGFVLNRDITQEKDEPQTPNTEELLEKKPDVLEEQVDLPKPTETAHTATDKKPTIIKSLKMNTPPARRLGVSSSLAILSRPRRDGASSPSTETGGFRLVADGIKERLSFVGKFIALLSSFPKKIFRFRRKESAKTRKNIFAIGGVLFLFILVGLFTAWWFLPKATVEVFVTTKRLDEKVEVFVDPNIDSVNEEERILPGTSLSTNISGERTKSTSGSKTVGEQAKGTITLYRVGPALALDAGDFINGPNDLKYTLDEDVTVASGSAGTPGTTDVTITAQDIGAQYNLASGSTFSVSNFSTNDIEGKNDSSFSGGTSREISAVSESDQTDLEKELNDELKEKGIDQLKEKLGLSDMFIDDSVVATASSKTFSSKVGDEASTLKLSLDLGVEALSINKDSLSSIVRNVLEGKIPPGFILRDEQIKTEFKYEGKENGKYKFTSTISANLLPEANPEDIARSISGRYPAIAKKYLVDNVPGFVRAEINFQPKLPGKLGTLPHIPNNIDVEIAAGK